MSASSRAGSFADTGCGIAPSFQQATYVTNQSTELGRATVTKSPFPTPRAERSRARRLPWASSSARVSDAAAHVTAGRSGAAAARS